MTATLEARIRATRLVVFDFDGVFTDNMVYVFDDGSEAVRCSRADGLGIEMLKELGVNVVILSTERNPIVRVRAEKLGIRCIHGCDDKLAALQALMQELSISLNEVAYVGNDINDLPALSVVGLPIVVRDAHADVVRVAMFQTERLGGNGAVREVCDLFLRTMTGGVREARQ